MKNLLIVLAVFAISLSGCGTRKKNLEKQITELKLKIESDSITIAKSAAEEKSSEKTVQKTEETQKAITVEVKDGEKVQVDEYGSDGKLKSSTVVSGSGKAKVEDSKKSTEKTAEKKFEKKAEASTFNQVKKKQDIEASQETKNLNVESDKGTFFGFWFWFWLIIIAIVIYLKYRFKSFSNLKKHVLNLFTGKNNLA